ncbi:TPA: hypothetical protein EYO57_23385 [Candidatus Poribacteria bacterium]|nr:hypothetical protein [Candidatus Poribacteria bacterium]
MLENKKGRTITFRVNDEAAQKLETYAKSDTLATYNTSDNFPAQKSRCQDSVTSYYVSSRRMAQPNIDEVVPRQLLVYRFRLNPECI